MTELSQAAVSPAREHARFDRIVPENIQTEISFVVESHRAAIEQICETNGRSFDSVLLAKEAADLELTHKWSPISHLSRVANTPELRAAHAEAPRIA